MADEKPPTTTPGMTEEHLNDFREKKLGSTVNNMLTARLATFEKKVTEKFGATIGEQLKAQMPELLKDFRPAEPPEGEGRGKRKDGAVDPELATLRQKMAALETENQNSRARADLLRERSRTQAIKEQVRSLLGRVGIDGDRFEAAYALLEHTGKIVKAEDPDSDEAFFRDSSLGDAVALEVGLGAWLKTDMAKIYLPPSGTRGAGSRPGARPGNGKPMTEAETRAAIAAALDAELQR
jgi:cell division protein FtsB